MIVLIVDDEKIFRRIIGESLNDILPESTQYIYASSEEQALSLIYGEPNIDLAIVDLYLPKIQKSDPKTKKSGLNVIRFLKHNLQKHKTPTKPKVIAITQYGDELPENDARESGADDFIEKTATRDKMKEKLKDSLKRIGVFDVIDRGKK